MSSPSPPGPDWFRAAVAEAPERRRIEVRGAGVETLAWGKIGDPGILLTHGVFAHADWWSIMAPLLAADGFRVAAFSLTGMGGSDWREQYAMSIYAEEAMATAASTGLFEAGAPITVVSHSYTAPAGAQVAFELGARAKAFVLVDRPVEQAAATSGEVRGPKPVRRYYPSEAAALARYRLMPAEPCDNDFIIDFIARRAVRQADSGGERLWTWRHDPELGRKTAGKVVSIEAPLKKLSCPVVFLRGARSTLFPAEAVDRCRALAPAGSQFVTIADAGHNIALQQPIALAATLSAVAGRPG